MGLAATTTNSSRMKDTAPLDVPTLITELLDDQRSYVARITVMQVNSLSRARTQTHVCIRTPKMLMCTWKGPDRPIRLRKIADNIITG